MSGPKRADNREVYLVQPKFPPSYWGLESMLRLTPFRAVNPPLGLLTLAALTPPEYRVTLCDENAGERVDYDTSAQIVGITGYNLQNARVYAHAQRFRARGKTVVLGGPLANSLSEECRLPLRRPAPGRGRVYLAAILAGARQRTMGRPLRSGG